MNSKPNWIEPRPHGQPEGGGIGSADLFRLARKEGDRLCLVIATRRAPLSVIPNKYFILYSANWKKRRSVEGSADNKAGVIGLRIRRAPVVPERAASPKKT